MRYSDLSPKAFFRGYVAPRKPVLIDGCLGESEGWHGGKWTNQYLRDKVRSLLLVPDHYVYAHLHSSCNGQATWEGHR